MLLGRLSETAALLFQAGYQGRDLQPLTVFSWKATFTGNHEIGSQILQSWLNDVCWLLLLFVLLCFKWDSKFQCTRPYFRHPNKQDWSSEALSAV